MRRRCPPSMQSPGRTPWRSSPTPRPGSRCRRGCGRSATSCPRPLPSPPSPRSAAATCSSTSIPRARPATRRRPSSATSALPWPASRSPPSSASRRARRSTRRCRSTMARASSSGSRPPSARAAPSPRAGASARARSWRTCGATRRSPSSTWASSAATCSASRPRRATATPGCASPRERGCGPTCGRRSRHASGSRASSRCTAPPRATSRCRISTAAWARSASPTPSSRTRCSSPASTSRPAPSCAAPTGGASRAVPARPASCSARSGSPARWTTTATPIAPPPSARSCGTPSRPGMRGSAAATCCAAPPTATTRRSSAIRSSCATTPPAPTCRSPPRCSTPSGRVATACSEQAGGLGAQRRLVDLAAALLRQLVLAADPHVPGHLVARELRAAVREQLLDARRRREDDEGRHVLAARGVGHPNHVRRPDRRVGGEHRLDLRGRDVHAGGLDDIAEPAEEVERPVGVDPAEVAGVKEALRVAAVRRLLPVVVAQQRRPAHADLPLAAAGQRCTRLGIADAQLLAAGRRPVASRSQGEGRVPGPGRAERPRLGHAEGADGMMVGRVEGARPARVGADALYEMEPGLREGRMRDQRFRLVRPGEEDRHSLRLEQGEGFARLEALLEHHRSPARERAERDGHEAAAKEEWQIAPRPVLGLDAEHRTDVLRAGDERAVHVHDALRGRRRSGGKDDGCRIAGCHPCGEHARPGIVERRPRAEQRCQGHRGAGSRRVEPHHLAQGRQRGVKARRRTRADSRRDLLERRGVIVAEEAAHGDQERHGPAAQRMGELARGIEGAQRHEHAAALPDAEGDRDPLGRVRQQEPDPRPLADAARYEGAPDGGRARPQLGEGEPPAGRHERLARREAGDDVVEERRERAPAGIHARGLCPSRRMRVQPRRVAARRGAIVYGRPMPLSTLLFGAAAVLAAGAGSAAARPVPMRGVIEGFYGPPWSGEARRDVIRFIAGKGMNTFVYAPKNDPFHRVRWRDPYPADALADLARTAAVARRARVHFVYALSPALDVCYACDADFRALTAKLAQVATAGVRRFALLFDDAPMALDDPIDVARFGGRDAAALARAQAVLANRTARWLRRRGLGRLVLFVPTDYAGDACRPYHVELGRRLARGLPVGWTGGGVFAPTITAAEARARRRCLRHPVVLWDNYPANDTVLSINLHLGPLTGRDPELPR